MKALTEMQYHAVEMQREFVDLLDSGLPSETLHLKILQGRSTSSAVVEDWSSYTEGILRNQSGLGVHNHDISTKMW